MDFEEYTEGVLKQIQTELPDCVDIDVDDEGFAFLSMSDGKTMMQQEFNIGIVKTLILQWNIQYILSLINE